MLSIEEIKRMFKDFGLDTDEVIQKPLTLDPHFFDEEEVNVWIRNDNMTHPIIEE